MDPGIYIKHLLIEDKSVTLPGFGTLRLREGGAEISETGKKLTPPGQNIKFDTTSSRDDEKLAARYSTYASIDPEEARQRVLEYVDAIKFALDKGESFIIEGVGTFIKNEDQKTLFEIDKDWILDPEQFGLEPLELLELNDESSADEPEVIITAGEKIEEAGELINLDKEYQEELAVPHKPFGKWKIIWIIVGILLVVLVLIILIPVNEDGRIGIRIGRESPVVRQNKPDQEVRDKANMDINEAESTPEENPTPVVEDKPAVTETPVVKNRYFIIAGSFRNLRNASDLQDQLKAEGFDSEIVITENRMYRVSQSSYPTKDEALNALEVLRKDSKYENYWVLSN